MFNKLNEAIALAEAREFEENALDFLLEGFNYDDDIFEFMRANGDIDELSESVLLEDTLAFALSMLNHSLTQDKITKLEKEVRELRRLEMTEEQRKADIEKEERERIQAAKRRKAAVIGSLIGISVGTILSLGVTKALDKATKKESFDEFLYSENEKISVDDIEEELDDDVEIEKLLESVCEIF